MIYFFSDLDNTLVYSHRVTLSGKAIAVEYLNDRIQSFMTKKTYDFLKESDDIILFPTTTRTCEQYARLSDTFAKFGCRYVLACNGGVLLINNSIDKKWLDETKEIAEKELNDLSDAERLLRQIHPDYNINSVNDIMLYFKTATPAIDADRLKRILNTNTLNIFFDSRKIYCIPSSINKGAAIKRLSQRLGIDYSISAGDSISDVSMLNSTNEAIMPDKISIYVENRHKHIANNKQCFSDYICDVLSRKI